MLVHLLRELAGQLDRLHVRPERAPEHALEEAFDLLLDGAEDAHAAGESFPRRPSLMLGLERQAATDPERRR